MRKRHERNAHAGARRHRPVRRRRRAEDKADNAKLIVGKWEIVKTEGGLPKGTQIEFSKDGKIKISGKRDDQDFTLEGTYKVDGDKFTVTAKQGDQERTQMITIKKLTKTELITENQEGKSSELARK